MSGHLLIVDASLGGIAMGAATTSGNVTWHAAHTDNGGSMAAIAGLYSQALEAAKGDVCGIVVAVGPGSFTGIKIGLAFVAGLIAGKPLPALGASGLAAAAATLKGAVLLPSTRTHGFLAEPGAEPRLIDTTALNAAPSAPVVHVVGAAGSWPAGVAWLSGLGKEVTALAPADVSRAAIYGMAHEAAKAWPHGFKNDPPAPRYLRLSTAEERLSGERVNP
jgi:tRNA A37 threonylcarbamoyladenosine modification protein TsaB